MFLDHPEHRRHLSGPGNVRPRHDGLDPQALNLAHGSLGAFLRFVVIHNDIGPGARQGQRDDATHAPSRAGYQGDLVVKWTIVHVFTHLRDLRNLRICLNTQIAQMTQITIDNLSDATLATAPRLLSAN